MSETISVLQWNVLYSEPIQNIASFLVANQADIICAQELTIGHPGQTVKDTPAYIASELGYNYYHKELPIEGTDGQKYMIANGIFSRFPITNSRFMYINEPKSGGGYSDEYRAYVEVGLDINGTPLTVGTTHMSYTHKFTETDSKKAETDKLVAELQKNPQGFIFSGDLNALPDSYTVNSIGQVLQPAGPDMAKKTWTTKPFSYSGFEATSLDWRLDYLFTSDDIVIESNEVLTTDYSDHLPLFAKISIK